MISAAFALAGCSASERLAEVGRAPALSPIENPTRTSTYRPVSMPMPAPQPIVQQANSLWRPGARAFFKDQRAKVVGDILTVVVALDDSAKINNSTARTRDAGEEAAIPNLLGFEQSVARLFPNGFDPTKLVDANSASKHTGAGQISRDESIQVRVAAVITQVLPNGNLVIQGRQEVRVNFEMRELQVAGIIRSEDITSTNAITSDKIAEARIAYGGRGQITDVQQPRYGQQVYDIIFPF
jgi:flagellar L-ring protein precursor FlgH